ncbi:L-PSP endoribonuclease family protein-like protein [Xylona heveae TC161]|uniref:L-PSP endoribonuclease family protein-like protein n=1 Tax=Xylona heveae (strain CBS 132557 / TC161) TaxID=1328760 RepID=A0A165FSY7_XYLHT|nr:L-PSP endoribonuclease family protein-like protein [Xylona heveae TC161]KZF21336.1 L-PSP endoribonuclease family protein-like protein [Xylona heveae TC161]
MSSTAIRHQNSTVATISTKKSYAPLGHYSQAFKSNGHIWLAGQIAADINGQLIEGSVADQARQICKNTEEILKEAGSSLDKAVKITACSVYTSDFSALPEFNEVYNSYFPQKPPRTSVEVSKLPLGVKFEMDVIAVE